MKRLGVQQVGEKQGVSRVRQPAFFWMETGHGQTQGNCVPTLAGATPPWQGNIDMAHWGTQMSINFTAEGSKCSRTQLGVDFGSSEIPAQDSQTQPALVWAWQPEKEEEEGRNLS